MFDLSGFPNKHALPDSQVKGNFRIVFRPYLVVFKPDKLTVACLALALANDNAVNLI